eukprot:6203435-Pleurochrysis_carterae.AAC.1
MQHASGRSVKVMPEEGMHPQIIESNRPAGLLLDLTSDCLFVGGSHCRCLCPGLRLNHELARCLMAASSILQMVSCPHARAIDSAELPGANASPR